MPDPLLTFLDDRSALLRQVAELGDFQPRFHHQHGPDLRKAELSLR